MILTCTDCIRDADPGCHIPKPPLCVLQHTCLIIDGVVCPLSSACADNTTCCTSTQTCTGNTCVGDLCPTCGGTCCYPPSWCQNNTCYETCPPGQSQMTSGSCCDPKLACGDICCGNGVLAEENVFCAKPNLCCPTEFVAVPNYRNDINLPPSSACCLPPNTAAIEGVCYIEPIPMGG